MSSKTSRKTTQNLLLHIPRGNIEICWTYPKDVAERHMFFCNKSSTLAENLTEF